MSPGTARSLMWLAVILLLLGGMIPAPMARLAIAGVCVTVSMPSFFGSRGKIRILAGLLVLLGLAMMWDAYPEANHEWHTYRK